MPSNFMNIYTVNVPRPVLAYQVLPVCMKSIVYVAVVRFLFYALVVLVQLLPVACCGVVSFN